MVLADFLVIGKEQEAADFLSFFRIDAEPRRTCARVVCVFRS